MTKKHFIAIADCIKAMQEGKDALTFEQIRKLANCLKEQNTNFDRAIWMNYIYGECGAATASELLVNKMP